MWLLSDGLVSDTLGLPPESWRSYVKVFEWMVVVWSCDGKLTLEFAASLELCP